VLSDVNPGARCQRAAATRAGLLAAVRGIATPAALGDGSARIVCLGSCAPPANCGSPPPWPEAPVIPLPPGLSEEGPSVDA